MVDDRSDSVLFADSHVGLARQPRGSKEWERGHEKVRLYSVDEYRDLFQNPATKQGGERVCPCVDCPRPISQSVWLTAAVVHRSGSG